MKFLDGLLNTLNGAFRRRQALPFISQLSWNIDISKMCAKGKDRK